LKKEWLGHIALLLAQIIYALNFSLAKGLMPTYIQPFALVFFRIIGACILFWISSLFVPNVAIEKADRKRILILALCGVLINQVFFIWGLSITEPINSAIIMISNPIIVVILMAWLLKERIKPIRLIGLGIAITGAVNLLLFKGRFELGSSTLVGDTMTLINATSWAFFLILAKPLMQKYHPLILMRWLFLIGSIGIIPIGWNQVQAIDWGSFTSQAYFALGFVVVATTFLAYLLNIYGLKYLNVSSTSAYIYLQPFLASIVAMSMQKDELTPTKIVSGLLIILGLYLVNYQTTKKVNA
jgi:drug/metabolite transporter (DMT)-like permease